MNDYRGKAHESPLVWCVRCRQMVPSDGAKIMNTVYHVTPKGVYPYGICGQTATARPTLSYVHE